MYYLKGFLKTWRNKMKQLLLAVALLVASMAASAQCTTHTIMTADGRMVMCTTCCFNGNCTTSCF